MRYAFLVALSLLFATGCGGSAPSTTAPAAGKPSGKPADPTAAMPKSPPVEGAEQESPAPGKTPAQPAKGTAAGTAVTASPAKPKPPAVPTAEQLAQWAVPDYQPLQLLACYDGFSDAIVQALAVSPDGKQFALGGAKLTLWNLLETQPSADLFANLKENDFDRPVRSVAISPDGNLLAAGDQKGMLRLIRLADRSEAAAIRAHDGRLTHLAFSPDSKVLATTSYAGEVRLWNATDGQKIKNLKVSDQEVARMIFLSDQRLAVSGKDVALWNIESGTQETVLSKGYVRGSALSHSSDRKWLAYGDADDKIHLREVDQPSGAAESTLHGGASLLEFSQDGKWIATYADHGGIHIWDAARRQAVQVIDADGGRTSDFKWLPQAPVLVVATESGRVRLWGTVESAKSIGLEPMPLPTLPTLAADSRKPWPPARLQQVFDARSFPQLPGAEPQWSHAGMDAYKAPVSQPEAELFYRYWLTRAGWQEMPAGGPSQPGIEFRKEGCVLNVSFAADPTPAEAGSGAQLQIRVNLSGNYNAGWLPKVTDIISKSSYSSFSSVLYRTKKDLTDVEAELLKRFHEAGWTGYSRLNSSSSEQQESRTFTMLQGGSELIVSIQPPTDAPGELAVQTSVSISNKSLPIPPDSGWIEFDSSTDLQLVATTKMDLAQTTQFYDAEMAAEGWLARDAGRHIQEDKAWLPFIRGQQDVLVRLVALPEGKTRVLVGEAERSSWQLKKPQAPRPDVEAAGLEAADFPIPEGATKLKYDVDEKQIWFDLADVTPPVLAENFIKQFQELGWKKESAGVMSDEYVLITLSKGKAEFQVRARAMNVKNSSVSIGGDGLLWTKPLPTAPVRLSYETWLRRNHFEATLDRLDQFLEEMHKISASAR